MQDSRVFLVGKGLKQCPFRSIRIGQQPERLIGMSCHDHVIEKPGHAVGHFHEHPLGPAHNGPYFRIQHGFDGAVFLETLHIGSAAAAPIGTV